MLRKMLTLRTALRTLQRGLFDKFIGDDCAKHHFNKDGSGCGTTGVEHGCDEGCVSARRVWGRASQP
jgi:hypothetical protein